MPPDTAFASQALSSRASASLLLSKGVTPRGHTRCQRCLADMGVSLQVWVHDVETPHDRLFVFKPDELKSLNMVTAGAAGAPAAAPSSSPAPMKTGS
jgi:hypothetical protein